MEGLGVGGVGGDIEAWLRHTVLLLHHDFAGLLGRLEGDGLGGVGCRDSPIPVWGTRFKPCFSLVSYKP